MSERERITSFRDLKVYQNTLDVAERRNGPSPRRSGYGRAGGHHYLNRNRTTRTKRRRLITSSLLLLLLALTSGCSRSVKWLDQRDRSGVLVQRALARKDEGDIDSAIKLYAEALDDNQRLARTHLDIALLLHHYKEDYVRAIYHYERYLELCPQTEKRDMIENRIRIAKQSFVASVVPGGRKNVPEARLTDDRVAPAGQATTWAGKPDQRSGQQMPEEGKKSEEVGALKKENAALKSRVKQLMLEVRPSNTGGGPDQPSPPSLLRGGTPARNALHSDAGGQNAELETSSSAPQQRGHPQEILGDFRVANSELRIRTYRVKRGDTLASIATEICKDAGMWKKIYEANRDKLRSPDDIKVGQILVIP